MFGAKLGGPYPRLTKAQLTEMLNANYDRIVGECAYTCKLFGVKRSDLPLKGGDNFIGCMLKYINGKLDVQYGLKIKAETTKHDNYKFSDEFQQLFDDTYAIKN